MTNGTFAVALKLLCIQTSAQVVHIRVRLGDREARLHEHEPFQRGYDRGRAYLEIMKQRYR